MLEVVPCQTTSKLQRSHPFTREAIHIDQSVINLLTMYQFSLKVIEAAVYKQFNGYFSYVIYRCNVDSCQGKSSIQVVEYVFKKHYVIV